ncbi:MAG: LysM peptidoglycan-binding domain-containing protein [Paludibacter sp.]|nr:LysM peptidoglycan-binding domain-containing protein [Paludibacter sp.]
MKKNLLFTCIILFISLCLFSQNQTAKLPTKTIKGVEYYIYTVQQAEGLYSISKKFHVTQAEINTLNPEIQNGLKNGQQIIIPVNNENKNISLQAVENKTGSSENKIAVSPQANTNVTFIDHVVLKKQTIFAISKQYNVSQDEILKYNPELKNGLKAGMTLKIPVVKETQTEKKKSIFDIFKKNKDNQEKEEIKSTGYIEHEVKAKETLYSISKLYNIGIEDIILNNPEAEHKLTIGTILKIPQANTLPKVNKQNQKEEKTKVEKENTVTAETPSIKPSGNFQSIKLAFILPFMLENKTDAINDKFTEFYAGALEAVNEAKKEGLSFDIYTYDSEKSENRINEVITSQELKSVDLIIGPAYTNQISAVSQFAKDFRINTLIPFSSKVYDFEKNPYLIQFNPSQNVVLDFMVEKLKTEYTNSNIIFCDLPGVSYADDGNDFSVGLRIKLKGANISYREVPVVSFESFEQSYAFQNNMQNIVIFNTDKFSLVNQYISALSSIGNKYDILLYEQYSWQTNNLLNINTFCIAPFKSLANSPDIINYETKFYKAFQWHPENSSPRYDILGYDLTKFFIKQIHTNGFNFARKELVSNPYTGLQSELKFERDSDYSGLMNKQLYLIKTNRK